STEEFAQAGFAEDRLRWLSQPHLRGPDLRAVLDAYGVGLEALLLPADSAQFAAVRTKAGAAAAKGLPLLVQLPGEDLYLFNPLLGGAAWFDACGLPTEVAAWLKNRWRDRSLLPLPGGNYVPIYRFWAGTAWQTLSWEEKQRLEGLFHAKSQANDQLWAERGNTILSVLKEASDMLPCAEDLGAIPPCVPQVLQELGILGLRIPRWTRYYDRPGAPYIPAHEYPQLSVCALSVHDTSTLRAWWELEDGREDFARAFVPEAGQSERNLSPDTQLQLMNALSRSNSAIFMAQLQDYTDLAEELRSADPSADRVNVPGTMQDSNWTWRMRQSVRQLSADKKLLERIKQISRRS
ncbi:MAG: 4-alpha-glucanotransferase, partial [Spirochaetes bacterium]|nr:4-alpha-glucanotransferase [Spirochaetota bacterium]MBU0954711.1 4-alpha-glucanotransferase [Spirochaetota bacterium]